MVTYWVLSAIAFALSIAGNIMVILKKRYGFLVWCASNALWIVINLMSAPNWFQIMMFLVYTGFNIQGFLYWGKTQT